MFHLFLTLQIYIGHMLHATQDIDCDFYSLEMFAYLEEETNKRFGIHSSSSLYLYQQSCKEIYSIFH